MAGALSDYCMNYCMGAVFRVKFQSSYSHWPRNELQMNQTPETQRGTVEGETKAMVNKDKTAPLKNEHHELTCLDLKTILINRDTFRCIMSHCLDIGYTFMSKRACAHTILNRLSQDSEQNNGKDPSLLSTEVALTWKLSQAIRETDLHSTGLNMDYSWIFRVLICCVCHLCSSFHLPVRCIHEGKNRGSLPLCSYRWSYKALVPVYTHPHLEGGRQSEGETESATERGRQRVWSCSQKFHKGRWWGRQTWAAFFRGVCGQSTHIVSGLY